jgi:hypothetical protein
MVLMTVYDDYHLAGCDAMHLVVIYRTYQTTQHHNQEIIKLQ